RSQDDSGQSGVGPTAGYCRRRGQGYAGRRDESDSIDERDACGRKLFYCLAESIPGQTTRLPEGQRAVGIRSETTPLDLAAPSHRRSAAHRVTPLAPAFLFAMRLNSIEQLLFLCWRKRFPCP